MDENTVVNGGESWVNDVDLAQYGMPGRKGYTRTVTYADGRKVLEIYEYGTDGVLDSRQTGVDLEVKKKFEDLQKKPNPAAQSETISAPPNQPFVLRDGPQGIKEYPNPNAEGPKLGQDVKIEPDPSNPGQYRKVTRSIDAQGNGVAVIGSEPATDAELIAAGLKKKSENKYMQIKQDPTSEKWFGLKPDGNWEEMQGGPSKPAEKPTIAVAPNGGGAIQYIPDPDHPGQVIAAPIPGTEAKPLGLPLQWKPNPAKPLGEELRARRDDLWGRTQLDKGDLQYLSPQEAKDLLETDYKLATLDQTQANTTNRTLLDQRTQDITQRNQDLTDINQRRTFSNDVMNQGFANTVGQSGHLPKGSDAGGRAFLAYMDMAKQYAQDNGGFRDVPNVPSATLNINGIGTLTVPMHTTPTAQPPAGFPLPNIGGGNSGIDPTAPMSAMNPDNMKGPVPAPEIPAPPMPEPQADHAGISQTLTQLGIPDDVTSRTYQEATAGVGA